MIEQYVNREELQRLLSTLLVVIGAICLFALFAFIVVPGLRNANQPLAGPAVNPPQGETGWLDVAEYPPAKGHDVPPVDPKVLLAESPGNLERGKAIFATNCAACHGDSGQGDGMGGKGLNPPPRNFTKPEGWKNGPQLPAIYRTLSEGIKGSSMAAFDTLAVRDRMAVAHYVQSLGSFPHGDDPKALESFGRPFASKGERVPAKIPVSAAMTKIESEYRAPMPLVIPAASGTAEGDFMRRLVVNPAKAARTLAGIPDWQTDVPGFEKAVVSGAPENGFAVGAATLQADEWKEFHGLLARMNSSGTEPRPASPWHGESPGEGGKR